MDVRVLFLHGVGPEPDSSPAWLSALNAGLHAVRHSALNPEQVVVPRYSDLWAEGASGEASGHEEPRPDDRYGFVDRQSRLAVGVNPFGNPDRARLLPDHLFERQAIKARFPDVEAFLRHSEHPLIMQRVLAELGDPAGEWLILGHSLGSAVAVEFLTHLPKRMRVNLLLTVGSPLGRKQFARFVDGHADRFDFTAVGGWLNVYNRGDLVSDGGGISSAIPQAVNVAVDGRSHEVSASVADPRVAETVARALYGETSTDMLPRPALRPEDAADLLSLIGLQLGWHTVRLLQSAADKGVRNQGIRADMALEDVRAAFRNQGADHAMTADIQGDLAVAIRGTIPRRQAARFLVALCSMKPFSPYEFDLPDDVEKRAQRVVAMDLGWNWNYIDVARAAVDEVERVFHGPKWKKPLVVGGVVVVGVAAALVAPFLLPALAPAGVAGGAAFVAALAALGPGGMAGGLAIIAGAGGVGGAALTGLGAALTRQSVAHVTQGAIDLMASALTAKRLGLADPGASAEWQILAAAQ